MHILAVYWIAIALLYGQWKDNYISIAKVGRAITIKRAIKKRSKEIESDNFASPILR